MDVIEGLGLPFDLVADVPDERLRVVGELNEALCDWVLDVLAAKGYRARDVQRGDTYFVFGGYPCSVVSFRLSRVWPGWRFGIWLNAENLTGDADGDSKVIQLFCQHDTAIDKFKPSASDLVVEVTRHDLMRMIEDGPFVRSDGVVIRPGPERHVQALAEQVRMHPFLSYEGITDWIPIDYHPAAMTVRYMASEHVRRAKRRLSHECWRRWASLRVRRASGMPYVAECGLHDYGLRSWPRFEVLCYLEDDPSDAELDEMWDLWRLDDGTDRGWGETTLRVSVYYRSGGKECQLY